ncbi:hypothetical protein [Dongia sp.]|uniref:hypothetical protein n=1 Tax=Dongia sp. TaxID=1977262 RepID=UPI0035B03D3B
MTKLYVIGDREAGVLFVKTEPLKLTHISKATIETYAAQKGQTFDNVFAQIAAGAKSIINKTEVAQSFPDLDTTYQAIGQLIGKGAVVSDADFCFIADIDDSDWSASRFVAPPLSSALADLNPSLPPDTQLKEGSLV